MTFWTALLALGALLSIFTALAALRSARAMRTFAELDPPALDRWPKLSMIIPACNEAKTIEPAMESKLAEDYPNLEIVLVEDRSTDSTPEIVDRIAAKNPQLNAIHIQHLPEGWLGKVHALQRGFQASSGDWVLFSDADVHLAPGTLRKAVAHAETRGLDHLTVCPQLLPSGFAVDCVISNILRTLLIGGRVWAIEDPKSRAAVGSGAFNLVRRSALERIHGLEQIKLDVADDVALGVVLKESGGRMTAVNGRDAVNLEFYPDLDAVAWGMEKNSFAVMGQFRYSRLFLTMLIYLWLEWSAWLALLLPHGIPALTAIGAAASAIAIATNFFLARWSGRAFLPGIFGPIASLVLAIFALRAAVLVKVRGGVLWRGTLYSVDALRAGMRVKFP